MNGARGISHFGDCSLSNFIHEFSIEPLHFWLHFDVGLYDENEPQLAAIEFPFVPAAYDTRMDRKISHDLTYRPSISSGTELNKREPVFF